MLTEQSVVKVEDLPRLAPGLTIASSPRGSSSPNYMIRGQRGAQNPTVLTDPAVAIYFAEVPLAHASGTNQSLFDLGSVQVLKGPQGTLFGRNSTAGAILIEPQAPVDRFEGYGMATAGNYDYSDVEGVLNVPLSETIAIRAGAKVSRRDGYLENLATGQNLNDVDVFVNNVTDEYYFTSAVNAIPNLGTAAAYQGAPRMYGLSIRVPFGQE